MAKWCSMMLAQLRFRVQMLAVDPTKKIGERLGWAGIENLSGLIGLLLGPLWKRGGEGWAGIELCGSWRTARFSRFTLFVVSSTTQKERTKPDQSKVGGWTGQRTSVQALIDLQSHEDRSSKVKFARPAISWWTLPESLRSLQSHDARY